MGTRASLNARPINKIEKGGLLAMRILAGLGRVLASWYFLVPVTVAIGIAAGALIFVYVSPGQPKVGVINIPYTVIFDRSAYGISKYIDYARRDDSIKAVVIKLSTPGGGASASERLYIETRKLREQKPVVVVMGGLVASGGYMMSMGASYTYAQTSSLVGNVGVVSVAGPLLPELPGETTVFSSPHKLDGGTRREWIGAVDLLNEAFGQMVVAERGDRLRISREELMEGRIYPGMVAVRLGLADEIGGDSDGIRKAAELARISNYGLVDVNLEVLREQLHELERILPSGEGGTVSALSDAVSPLWNDRTDEALAGAEASRLQALRELMFSGVLGGEEEDPFPDLPWDIHRPNIYYLYVGSGN